MCVILEVRVTYFLSPKISTFCNQVFSICADTERAAFSILTEELMEEGWEHYDAVCGVGDW